MATNKIVPPEPHSSGFDLRRSWIYGPRWLRVLLLLIFLAAGVLLLTFVKGFLPKDMKWSVLNILIVIPLVPLIPVVVTWYLPWESWIPKRFSKWIIGPYLLYVSIALWHFKVSGFAELFCFLVGTWTLIRALEQKFNN